MKLVGTGLDGIPAGLDAGGRAGPFLCDFSGTAANEIELASVKMDSSKTPCEVFMALPESPYPNALDVSFPDGGSSVLVPLLPCYSAFWSSAATRVS